MTSSIVYNRVKVKLKSGEYTDSENISLESGNCVGAYFIPTKKYVPDFEINISVENSQGGVMLNATDYRDYQHKGGGYFQGMKQLNFPTKNNRFFVTVNADKALTEDFEGQLIFAIQRENE